MYPTLIVVLVPTDLYFILNLKCGMFLLKSCQFRFLLVMLILDSVPVHTLPSLGSFYFDCKFVRFLNLNYKFVCLGLLLVLGSYYQACVRSCMKRAHVCVKKTFVLATTAKC